MTDSILDPGNFRQLLLIVNPVAGRKLSRKYLPEIIGTFTNGGCLVTALITEKRGDAVRFAADFGGRFDLIVCVGGDGTLNETVSGLAAAGLDKPLGYIPAGSTNVFADCHGLSGDPVAAARDIVRNTERRFDLGKFNDAYFSYIAAFGAFSWLSYSTPQSLKNMLGHTAYILDSLRELPLLKEERLKLSWDGGSLEGDYIFGAVTNCNSLACTFPLPQDAAVLDDGLFEVLLVRPPRSVADLQAVVASLRTQDYPSRHIEFFQASRLCIENSRDLNWTLDGELAPAAAKIIVENLPKSLRLIC